MTKKELEFVLKHHKWSWSSIETIGRRPSRFGVIFGAATMLFINVMM